MERSAREVSLICPETIIRTHPSLSYLSHLLPTDPPDPLPSDLNRAPHLTIFAPSNAAFHNAFDKIEKQYLEGGYGTEGVGRIVGGGVLMGIGKKDGGVGWRDYWREKGDEGEWQSRFTGSRLTLRSTDCHSRGLGGLCA